MEVALILPSHRFESTFCKERLSAEENTVGKQAVPSADFHLI